jgi:glucosyl-dolichyl phosphate glucuronosyltransferase
VTPSVEPVRPLCATVLICTFNRSDMLRATLESLARMDDLPGGWDVLVVDNNSTDRTEEVVAKLAQSYPVGLRYLRELRQGKSYALNVGIIATTSRILAFTDDDVVVTRRWLIEAVRPLLTDPSLDYTGGPVRPIWEDAPPRWLPAENGNLWGTIAVLDYGAAPFIFEDRRRIPIGANMAVRRSAFDKIGGFNAALGRKGKSLLGQEQAEFFYRTRAQGLRGMYVPEMELHHHVPKARLTRRYFRRWWFWKGISRARLHRLHPETELGLDLRRVPRIQGVPRFALGEVLEHVGGLSRSVLQRDPVRITEEEMRLMYSVGYVVESWRGRVSPPVSAVEASAPDLERPRDAQARQAPAASSSASRRN